MTMLRKLRRKRKFEDKDRISSIQTDSFQLTHVGLHFVRLATTLLQVKESARHNSPFCT